VHLGIFIGSLFLLLIGLLIDGAENIANGQTSEFDPRKFDPLQTDCVPYYDEHIVIIKNELSSRNTINHTLCKSGI
jgi:hypothetical protein